MLRDGATRLLGALGTPRSHNRLRCRHLQHTYISIYNISYTCIRWLSCTAQARVQMHMCMYICMYMCISPYRPRRRAGSAAAGGPRRCLTARPARGASLPVHLHLHRHAHMHRHGHGRARERACLVCACWWTAPRPVGRSPDCLDCLLTTSLIASLIAGGRRRGRPAAHGSRAAAAAAVCRGGRREGAGPQPRPLVRPSGRHRPRRRPSSQGLHLPPRRAWRAVDCARSCSARAGAHRGARGATRPHAVRSAARVPASTACASST